MNHVQALSCYKSTGDIHNLNFRNSENETVPLTRNNICLYLELVNSDWQSHYPRYTLFKFIVRSSSLFWAISSKQISDRSINNRNIADWSFQPSWLNGLILKKSVQCVLSHPTVQSDRQSRYPWHTIFVVKVGVFFGRPGIKGVQGCMDFE